MTSTLTYPLFLAPIVIPTTGTYLTVVDGGSTAVSLTAGTYYWDKDSGVSGSFNAHLKAQLESAYGGSWTITLSTTTYLLTVTYAGASTPTSITFADTDVLDAHDLGDSLTVDDASITLTSKSWTGTYKPRWLWRPAEYLLDDQTIPQALSVVAVSPFDGSATIDNYGEWSSRSLVLFSVAAARVYQWAADDSGHASQASVAQYEPHHHLERLWRDCRTQTGSTSTPLALRMVVDETDWNSGTYAYESLAWQDAEQLNSLSAVAQVLSEGPLLYTVTMRVRDTG